MTYSAEVLADSPVFFLNFDETSGTSCADAGSNGTAWTYASSVTLSDTPLVADGGHSAKPSGNNPGLAKLSAVPASLAAVRGTSAEIWVNLPSASLAGQIMCIGSGNNGWIIAVGNTTSDDSGNHLIGGLNNVSWNPSGVNIGTGIHQIGISISAAGLFTFYIDGVSVGTQSSSSPITATTACTIGSSSDTASSHANTPSTVKVDAFSAYGSVLSAARFLAHYNAGIAVATQSAVAAMSAQASLGDAGADTTSQSSAMSARASLAAAPSVTESVADAMSAQASLVDVGVVGTVVGMSAQASMSDAASITEPGADAMSAQSSLVAAPAVTESSAAGMSAQAGLAGAPSVAHVGVTGMSAQASLAADGTVVSTTTTMAFTFGALDLEIDTTPHAVTSAMAFTFGGLELAMTSGAPAMALYDEHNNWLANLPKAIIGNWMVELSAPGALTCSLPMDDSSTALATKKRILKVFWRGRARQAARIDGSSIQVAKDGRRWRQFNDRPGALDMFADIAVFPEVETNRASSSQRICGFMSRRGPWYDSGNWTPGIGYRFTDESDYKRGRPIGLSYPNPFWISKYGPHVTRPVGSAEYLRKEFTTTAVDMPYQILTTGDNFLWLWLDGEPLVTPDTIGAASYHSLAQIIGTLPAGKHVLAAKIVNSPGGKYYNPVGFIFTLQQRKPNGDIVPGIPTMNSDLTWSVSDIHPGFRGGDVIVTLFKEAADRATAAGQWFQAVSTISLGFDHTRDSHGVPWADAPTEHQLDAGSTVLSAVQQIAEKDLDVVLDPGPMVLNAYNLLGEDLSGSVFLNVGSGVTGSLLQHMIDRVEARENTALIQLADGRWIVEQDLDSVAEIGRVEVGLSLGSTSDDDTAASVAQKHFAESANTTFTFTTTVTDLEGPQPLIHFNLGDSISVTDETATGHFKTRVMAMTFKPNGRRVSIDVELALDPT